MLSAFLAWYIAVSANRRKTSCVPSRSMKTTAPMLHLLERNHTERFTALTEGFMPNSRAYRATPNSGVLGHEFWEY